MVEAGATLNKSFIEENLVDKLIQFVAPKLLGDSNGVGFVQGFSRNMISECNNLKLKSVRKLKHDVILNMEFLKP